MIELNGNILTPTMFPDGTSQVWHLDDKLLESIYKENAATVLWNFENEAELIHVAQLKTLIDTYCTLTTLSIPFLPYGRQDKRVSNQATFALRSFATLINAMKFDKVETIDAHSNTRANLIDNLVDHSPREFIEKAMRDTNAECVVYPDEGASIRYNIFQHYRGVEFFNAYKERDQSTGWISKVWVDNAQGLNGKIVILVDDLADGGLTFRLLAKPILEAGAKKIHLYVSHGIFSKGVEVLREAGIERIFTWRGEVLASAVTPEEDK